jgi:hypothetical protein
VYRIADDGKEQKCQMKIQFFFFGAKNQIQKPVKKKPIKLATPMTANEDTIGLSNPGIGNTMIVKLALSHVH